MGHVKKILASKRIQPIPTFYSDKLAMELAENFHLHLRNLRIEWDSVEFEKIAKMFCEALEKWNKFGRPTSKEYSWLDGSYYPLGDDKIPPIPGLFDNGITNDELRIEIQKWADYVHLHYKELRIEFSVEEFNEFTEVVLEAARKLGQYSEGNPKRFGKFQRACPHGRVEESSNSGKGFWVESPNDDTGKPYATTFRGEDIASRTDTRLTSSAKLKKLDVRDLFDITLFHSPSISPWACDENGVLLPLLYRYQFVKEVFESSGELNDSEIRATNYWNLLSKGITERPRDGGGGWIYKNPMEQCQRFLTLIKSVKTYGYIGEKKDHASYKDFELTPEIFEANGISTRQKDSVAGFPGLISVMASSGAYKVYNGLHRLAILKYLWDIGQLPSPRILVRKNDDSPFTHPDMNSIKFDGKGYPIGRKESFLIGGKNLLAREKNLICRVSRKLCRVYHKLRSNKK